MDRCISNARRLRSNLTDAESCLWKRLRSRQLLGIRFRRQAPIGKYVVDFISYEANLIIELDGGQHALQQAYDERRTAWLESQGFRVLRFWNHDVLQKMDAVLEVVCGLLTPPTLSLPHKGGGHPSLCAGVNLGDATVLR